MNEFERIKQTVDYLRYIGIAIKHEDISEKLGRNRVNVTKALNGDPKYLTKPFLKAFAAAYSEYINEDWLLTGEGVMAVPDRSLRPHFEASASAGFMVGASMPEAGTDLRTFDSTVGDYDFTITARGSSMEPVISDGDVLACRILSDRLNPPLGEICVIDSTDGAAVKQIGHISEHALTLHSINPQYADYTVSFADINRIAEVIALVRQINTRRR